MTNILPPEVIRVWMSLFLQNGAFVTITKLEKCLLSLSISSDQASQAVNTALNLGILVPKVVNANGRGRGRGKGTKVRFYQKLATAPGSLKDEYCLECHLTKREEPESESELQHCLTCARSFHAACHRKDPHKPNYSVPSYKGQTYKLPVNESDTDLEDNNSDTNNDDNSNIISPESELTLDHNSNVNLNPHADSFLKHEHDDDVFFVSEQPASVRRRRQSQIKSEFQALNDIPDVDMELELCTVCRLQKFAALHNPPHLGKEELNCLLDYSWKSHQSWLSMDVRKYITKHWSRRDGNLVKRLLFRNDILGLSDITKKISNQKYKYLTELLIDLIDLQHNIGIFFGTKCQEYNDTKWLLRDVTHDIREIRRCPDCYRFSSEANRSTFWFAKPCLQRHELVYAKQSGSPPWPAKVIRVLSRKPNKYDVRFFGGSHSRALVAARDILPIDADISAHLKKRNSRALSAAVQELKCHEMLSRFSASFFGYHSNPQVGEQLIQNALRHYAEEFVTDRFISTPTPTTIPANRKRNLQEREPTILAPFAKRLRSSTPAYLTRHRKSAAAVTSAASIDMEGEYFDEANANISSSGDYHQLASELLATQEELFKCKSELAIVQQNLEDVKRRKWCYFCLKEAIFDCCFSASYCSVACKRKDKRAHLTICKLKQ
ncbi:zinc finger MYND domain-containing protein 11 [Drosophila willistoni]|uniref:zinc finger MYND domain-containing protein 11 n=1 Tax=Drosophila willistoni TaxID=7260 RepID=UPI00017D6FAA|nr:zinc finger MYND domain-containing protein 11 [Drosophila willistoni]